MGVDVFIGIGSNQGDSLALCREAVDRLSALPGLDRVEASSFYKTPPFGITEQPDFVNAVVRAETSLPPAILLQHLLDIEQDMGRQRREKWGPRLIDLDLLLYGDEVIQEATLEVPHPGIAERGFVLVPLCELAPDRVHPESRRTLQQLLEDLGETGKIEKIG